MRCFSLSFSHTFDFVKLQKQFGDKYKITKFEEVLHFNLEGDVFIFSYGAIVCWGLTKKEEEKFHQELLSCLGERLGAEDDDLHSYSYGNIAKIKDEHIILPNKHIDTKLAFSHGLAQSVKLGGFENTIQNIIDHTKKLPESLADKGKIPLSRKEISKLMGKIFIDRNSINLHLELLDAPNFFWDNEKLEPLHEMITEYLDQENRVKILNQRLLVIQELLDMLATELNNQHSSKLEWIIIILIFIEVTVMFAKEIFHIL